MIDFDKLKIAYDIAASFKHRIAITTYSYFKNLEHLEDEHKFRFHIDDADFYLDETYYYIEDLIAKLKELTKPEKPKPKFNIGEEVWFMTVVGEMRSFCIDKIYKVTSGETYYYNKYNQCVEENNGLYSTKQELIEAQIQHWTCLKNQEKSCAPVKQCDKCGQQVFGGYECPCNSTECQHESQTPDRKDNVHMCIKCFEEFYMDRPCQHESDGRLYFRDLPIFIKGDPMQVPVQLEHKKCTKCGEFYK